MSAAAPQPTVSDARRTITATVATEAGAARAGLPACASGDDVTGIFAVVARVVGFFDRALRTTERERR
jgi:hypothetical protein